MAKVARIKIKCRVARIEIKCKVTRKEGEREGEETEENYHNDRMAKRGKDFFSCVRHLILSQKVFILLFIHPAKSSGKNRQSNGY